MCSVDSGVDVKAHLGIRWLPRPCARAGARARARPGDQRIQKMTDRIRERPRAQKKRRPANGKATRIDSHEGGGRARYRGTGSKTSGGHDGEIPLCEISISCLCMLILQPSLMKLHLSFRFGKLSFVQWPYRWSGR